MKIAIVGVVFLILAIPATGQVTVSGGVVTATAGSGASGISCVLQSPSPPLVSIQCSQNGVSRPPISSMPALDPVGGPNGGDFGSVAVGSNLITWMLEQKTAGVVTWSIGINATGPQVTGTFTGTVNNPAPVLTSISPASAAAGSSALTLTVNGTGFVNGSIVNWNGSPRGTTYGSATQLQAAITATDLANTGTAQVSVVTPAPGGGTSNNAVFTITMTSPPPPPTAPTNLMAVAVSSSQVNLTWTASTGGTGSLTYAVFRCQGAGCSNFAADGTTSATSLSDGSLAASTIYNYQVQAVDSTGAASGFSNTATVTTLSGTGTTYSFWTPEATPKIASDPDTGSVELGLRFQSSTAGSVIGVRFYKGSSNTGTHTGHLWSSTGTLLASVTFSGETASGWQQANFSSPVAVQANTMYVISYHAPVGRYAADSNYFTSTLTSGPLTAPVSGNGAYAYGSYTTFPNSTYQASNYWVDVVFQ
jgi:uncharacterized protein DUF4082